MFENTWHYHNERKQPTWLLLTASLFRSFNSLSSHHRWKRFLCWLWYAVSNLFLVVAFSSSVFLFFLCHSCATSSLALATEPCGRLWSYAMSAGRYEGRQEGRLITGLRQPQIPDFFFFFLSEHLTYWLLSGCKENFNKYSKNVHI